MFSQRAARGGDMKKSAVILVVVLTAVTFFAGCGSGVTNTTHNPTPSGVSVEGHTYVGNVGNSSVTISFHNGIEKVTLGSASDSHRFTQKDRIISDSNGGKFQVSADGMEITGVVTWEGREFKRIE
jgi:hypothetical protein